MNFPPPTEKQARVLWFSLTALAVGVLLALLVFLGWVVGWLINQLSSVLLPLAVAAVLACLLDPAVDYLEARLRIPRTRAILLVFFLAVMLVLILLATVAPQITYELKQFIDSVPQNSTELRERVSHWLAKTPWGARAKEAWDTTWGAKAQQWLTDALPIISEWLLAHFSRVVSWAGLLFGLALVPVYAFYFLFEKEGIQRNWTDYLPLRESKVKEEVVFIIRAINDCLVVFFRGQVLVSLCSGGLLLLGFLALQLKYAVLLGALAALLGIVPYLGGMICVMVALTVALAQFHDWQHPLLVVGIYGLVQMAEGLYVSPRIIGNRVGLHPLTIIIAVMIGTTLLGGILGGVLAIPLTAALRTLMFRYVWKKR